MSIILKSLLSTYALLWIFFLILWILQIIAYWRIFTKAGQPGWKSIIPIYSDYTLFKIVWKPKYFWFMIISGMIYAAAGAMLQTNSFASAPYALTANIIYVAFGLIGLLLEFFLCRKTAFAYGKGGGFAIGLFILNPIFTLILGLGGSQYQGRK